MLFCSCVFFSPFSIAITSLGEERELILVLFIHLFDLRLFIFVCPLPIGWEGPRLVIVAFPGLFSYLFSSLYSFDFYVFVDVALRS